MFLYTNNKHTEKKSWEQYHSEYLKKYLGINLTKEVTSIYNFKPLKKEI